MVKDFFTPRVSPSLLHHEILLRRKTLSLPKEHQYNRRYKGLVGERILATFLKKVNLEKALPLYGLLFEANETEFQIDCLLLTAETIFLLEVKNYIGNYYIDDDKIYSLQTNKEITSPFLQLERCTFLFNKLLEQLKVTIDVRSYIVFVNNNFTLYQAPTHLPIIFPTQINRFVQKINANSTPLTNQTKSLAKLLTSHHQETSAYEQLPSYEIDDLNRGVFCAKCRKKLYRKNKLYFKCKNCDILTHINIVILHATAEYHTLFPTQRITTKQINDWCGNAFSKNTVRNVLRENLQVIPNGRYTHYLFHNRDDSSKLLAKSYYD